MNSVFNEAVHEIETAYSSLGYSLGWRFLYTPASTLSPNCKLMFMGLNPGGGVFEPPMPSVEAGNAYRVEPWGPDGRLSTLQKQICALYDSINQKLDTTISTELLMDETLAANLIPFRSKRWNELANKSAALEFSTKLWSSLLQNLAPNVIICLTSRPYDSFKRVLINQRFQYEAEKRRPTGWGKVTYSLTTLSSSDRTILLLRLPHLSQFKLFSRPACQPAIEHFTTAIANRL
jgi:hypothetical protein